MKNRVKRVVAIILTVSMTLGLMSGCSKSEEKNVMRITSSVTSVTSDIQALETTITLQNMEFTDTLSTEQVKLDGAFENMTIKTVKRNSETEVLITADGTLAEDEGEGIIAFADNAVIVEKASEEESLTDEEKTAKEQIEAQEKNDFPYSVAISVLKPEAKVEIENTGDKKAAVNIKLSDDTFKNDLKSESFVVSVSEKPLKIASVERKDDTTCLVTFTETAVDAFSTFGDGTLTIKADALNSGKEIVKDFGVYDATLAAKVDYVEEQGDEFVVTTILHIANGTFANIDASAVTVGGDFVKIVSVEKNSEDKLTIETTVKKNSSTIDNLELNGSFAIEGVYAKTLWGAEKSDGEASVYYNATEANKELLAVETSLVFDLIKTGLKSLATSAGTTGAKRVFAFIEEDQFNGDATAEQLSKLNDYLKSMDAKWTAALNELNVQVSIMSDKLGKNDCSRALDDFDTMADRLQSLVLHLENKKAAVDNAKKGTPEYEKAVAEYVKAVENQSTKIYTETHLLGQKLISGSSGLTQGIIGTYDEMLSYIYNFDVQTYDAKENFRIFVLSLYLEAYDETVLYYELTDPENHLLASLQNQIKKLYQEIDNLKVVRRADNDDYVYCYVLGGEVKRFAYFKSPEDAELPSGYYSIDETKAINMMKRAESRGTTLRSDLETSGFYSVNRMKDRNGLESEWMCIKIEHHSSKSKQKREWWTLGTVINIDTHEIKRDVKNYYQRQERNGFNAFFGIDVWDQTECWGSYSTIGLAIKNK